MIIIIIIMESKVKIMIIINILLLVDKKNHLFLMIKIIMFKQIWSELQGHMIKIINFKIPQMPVVSIQIHKPIVPSRKIRIISHQKEEKEGIKDKL